MLGAFADNLELFPYFVPQDGKGQTERKGQVRKVLEAVQDIFDLDHLAVYENKMLYVGSEEWYFAVLLSIKFDKGPHWT